MICVYTCLCPDGGIGDLHREIFKIAPRIALRMTETNPYSASCLRNDDIFHCFSAYLTVEYTALFSAVYLAAHSKLTPTKSSAISIGMVPAITIILSPSSGGWFRTGSAPVYQACYGCIDRQGRCKGERIDAQRESSFDRARHRLIKTVGVQQCDRCVEEAAQVCSGEDLGFVTVRDHLTVFQQHYTRHLRRDLMNVVGDEDDGLAILHQATDDG